MMTGAEVKEWREARDISQSRLAKLLPMNLKTLQGWERKEPRGTPPPFMCRALRDLERELTLGTRGAKASAPILTDDIRLVGGGRLCAAIDEHYGPVGQEIADAGSAIAREYEYIPDEE